MNPYILQRGQGWIGHGRSGSVYSNLQCIGNASVHKLCGYPLQALHGHANVFFDESCCCPSQGDTNGQWGVQIGSGLKETILGDGPFIGQLVQPFFFPICLRQPDLRRGQQQKKKYDLPINQFSFVNNVLN